MPRIAMSKEPLAICLTQVLQQSAWYPSKTASLQLGKRLIINTIP